jgi:hypothetical protein
LVGLLLFFFTSTHLSSAGLLLFSHGTLVPYIARYFARFRISIDQPAVATPLPDLLSCRIPQR